MSEEQIPYHRPYPLNNDDVCEIQEELAYILQSGILTNGKNVKKLEQEVKKLYNVKYAIATSNCTVGLTLCFQFLDWFLEMEMPNFTWMSPYLMIYNFNTGLRVEFIDINKKTWLAQMDGEDRYILSFPTHTFGNIIEVRGNHTIYDGAHALGSKIKEFGDATVLSLAPTKLVTSCEGGLILTNQDDLEEFVRFRRDKCARMSEIHAVIGLTTLRHLEEIKRWKKQAYSYYKAHIPGQFQEIPIDSNYNTIGFLNTEHLIIPEHIEIKQYYEPIYQIDLLPNSYEVFKQMVCLPSWYGCPIEQIVEDIKEVNDL